MATPSSDAFDFVPIETEFACDAPESTPILTTPSESVPPGPNPIETTFATSPGTAEPITTDLLPASDDDPMVTRSPPPCTHTFERVVILDKLPSARVLLALSKYKFSAPFEPI